MFFLLYPLSLSAEGYYYIGKDDEGFYFQTDNHGGWYIDSKDLKYFKLGQNGKYSVGKDKNGHYLITDIKNKFYINTYVKQQQLMEAETYNQKHKNIGNQKESDIIINGNRILVPSRVVYKGKTIEVLLLLDTGASIVTLHSNIAEKLKIGRTKKVTITVAGGGKINGDLVQLDYIKVGPKKKSHIFTSIIDYSGPPGVHNGLLGMNFLKEFDYEIDYRRQKIKWR